MSAAGKGAGWQTDGMDLEAYARQMLDENRYVVLGTADEHGEPWVTPVFYSLDGYDTVLWLSAPDSRHSRNLAVRPGLSLVVYDSQVPVGGAKAVYMSGRAECLDGDPVASALAAYNAGSLPKGADAFALEKVTGDGHLRVYRATITAHWVLDPTLPRDDRTAVDLRS